MAVQENLLPEEVEEHKPLAKQRAVKKKAASKETSGGASQTGLSEILRWLAMVWHKILSMLLPVGSSDSLSDEGLHDQAVPSVGSKKKKAAPESGRKTKAAKGSEAAAAAVQETEDGCSAETAQRLRALRKKLREIDALAEAFANGVELNAQQASKLTSKTEIVQEIEALRQRAFLESAEAADREAQDAIARAAREKADEEARQRKSAMQAAEAAALAKARRNALEVLPNISPSSEAARTDPRLQTLLKQVSALSSEVFDDDCVQTGVSKKKGWKLTLLARPIPEDPENCPEEDPDVLLGFMVFRIRPDFGCMSIAKIAVPEENRGKGFGKYLMEWCVKQAQQTGTLQYLSLSSLPEAVKFYQKFGFKSVQVDVKDPDDDLIEGQVYMEYRIRQKPGAGRGGASNGRGR
eukprot:TRINITY_DN22316_c0_g1_i1.p1 TRINITY_DN22316_c0_g1~~TRINITY_DN22316_c0_g1_i1.p1  ORF type:complete len:409 (+),score=129.72 TRINITY_DN22316_c0_g1_i1:307-1533(+)